MKQQQQTDQESTTDHTHAVQNRLEASNSAAAQTTIPPQQPTPNFPLYQGISPPFDHDHLSSLPSNPPSLFSSLTSNALWFLRHAVWPGAGLLAESFLLFSTGTLQPVWQILYPECFEDDEDDEVCDVLTVRRLTYSVVLGILAGMVVFGGLATSRRAGSIATAAFMSLGSAGLALIVCWNDSSDSLRYCTGAFFVFGMGVGGEYPLSAASAAEQAAAQAADDYYHHILNHPHHHHSNNCASGGGGSSSNSSRLRHQTTDGLLRASSQPPTTTTTQPKDDSSLSVLQGRGKQVQLVFSMQGVGILLHCLMFWALLSYTNQGDVVISLEQDASDETKRALLWIWRILYLTAALALVGLWAGRVLYLNESAVWQQDQEQQHSSAEAIIQQAMERLEREAAQQQHSHDTGDRHGVLPQQDDDDDDHSHRAAHPLQGSSGGVAGNNNNKNHKSPMMNNHLPPVPLVSTVSSLSAPSVVPEDNSEDPNNPMKLLRHIPDDVSSLAHSTSTVPARRDPWQLLLRQYGVRWMGASLCWFLWDVAFYGNKLFQSHFLLLALTADDQDNSGEATLHEFTVCATVNAAIALLGYWGAAILLDHYGRATLQLGGLLATGCLFLMCGCVLLVLTGKDSEVDAAADDAAADDIGSNNNNMLGIRISRVVVALYWLSSLTGQLGPNATTYLIPAEMVPTAVRTWCHGVAAASGKLGALAAAIWFGYYAANDDFDLFFTCAYACLTAAAVSYYTIPETAHLALKDLDQQWHCYLQKQPYTGRANHPAVLSPYEQQRRLRKLQLYEHGQQQQQQHADQQHHGNNFGSSVDFALMVGD